MSKFVPFLFALLGLSTIAAIFFLQRGYNTFEPTVVNQIGLVQENSDEAPPDTDVTFVAENLNIPWEIAFLPDGDMLVTERPGGLLKIGQGLEVVEEIGGVAHVGEGGLLGVAVHPDFNNTKWIYLYLTTREGGGLTNRVERYELSGTTLSDRRVILEDIPGAANHDGGRMAFGPDGYLYITTGDAGQESLAQDTNSLAGKILRLTDEGQVPGDNPFGNEVWSYGHRNPQGLAWDGQERLWAPEHGPSGVQTGYDELNLIERGANYGWPEIRGDESRNAMMTPQIQSGGSETWAPAGAAFADGSIYFTGLRGETLYQAVLAEDSVEDLHKHFAGEYGRLRAVVLGPDGYLYITTSNRDGRGSVNSGDDKILKVHPSRFN